MGPALLIDYLKENPVKEKYIAETMYKTGAFATGNTLNLEDIFTKAMLHNVKILSTDYGHLIFEEGDKKIILMTAWIDENYRGKGHGKKLIEKLANIAADKKVVVDTFTDALIYLSVKNGFELFRPEQIKRAEYLMNGETK